MTPKGSRPVLRGLMGSNAHQLPNSSIFSRFSSATPSVGSAPWKLSTRRCTPLRAPSWPGRERDRLPARSTLSRFLAALTETPVEALRTLFLKDLLARSLNKEEQRAGLWDRQGSRWVVFDVDGTREAARQRARPQTADRPEPERRLRPLCAAFLHRTQARGNCAEPDHGVAGAYASVSGHVWKPRQWGIPCRTASGRHGHSELSCGASPSRRTGSVAPRRTIWHWSCSCRPGRAAVCDAWERLSDLEAARGPGSPDPASRSTSDPPGKWDGTHALGLS